MPLRDQIRHQNAEEMATKQHIAGKYDGKRAAVADHLRALKAGVKEILKTAFAEEEAKDWGPNTGARPRLKGMGITTVIAAVNIELIVTDKERTALERSKASGLGGSTEGSHQAKGGEVCAKGGAAPDEEPEAGRSKIRGRPGSTDQRGGKAEHRDGGGRRSRVATRSKRPSSE